MMSASQPTIEQLPCRSTLSHTRNEAEVPIQEASQLPFESSRVT